MKYLILCEGANEELIINILLDSDKLKISKKELIGLKPYNVRQLSNPTIKSELRIYNKPVIVIRVGDTQHDKLIIPEELKEIVSKDRIYKYCTLPEFEILLIINEDKYQDFKKSGEKKAKIYAKRNIIYNKRRYDQSSEFIKLYYGGRRVTVLIDNLKEYKRIKHHTKDQLYLVDLLK